MENHHFYEERNIFIHGYHFSIVMLIFQGAHPKKLNMEPKKLGDL